MHSSPHSSAEHFHDRFDSVTIYAEQLDNPEREQWQKPMKVIASLDIPTNGIVADIGAGTGYFVFRIAEQLPAATVIAIDSEAKMIAHINNLALKKGIKNIITAVATTTARPHFEQAIDRILCVNTYHHIPSRVAYVKQYIDTLATNGTITIIDFTADGPMGPPHEYRVSERVVVTEMEAAGLHLQQKHEFLENQYMLTFGLAQQ